MTADTAALLDVVRGLGGVTVLDVAQLTDQCPDCRGAGCARCDWATVPLPSLAGLPPVDYRLEDNGRQLRDELLAEIRSAIDNTDRTLQVSIGPSELGIECERRLAYMLAHTPEVNVRESPWRPTVGTAVHAWCEEVFVRANAGVSPARWLVETTVDVGELVIAGRRIPIRGHSDLYDRVTASVVDWKIVGDNTLKKVKARRAPTDQYRKQAHLYGRGFMRRGALVRNVSVFYLPQSGELRDGFFWSEPYDEQVAVDTLDRAQRVQTVVDTVGSIAPGLFPTTDAYCTYCPFYRPNETDLAVACPGDPGRNSYIPPGAKRSEGAFDGII